MGIILAGAGGGAAGAPFELELKRADALLVSGEPGKALALAQDVLRQATDPGAVAGAAHIALCALRQLDRADEVGPMYAELLEKQPDNWGLVHQNAI